MGQTFALFPQSDRGRTYSVVLTGGIGVLTLLGHMLHFFMEFDEPAAVIWGVVPTTILSIGLLFVSYWLWTSESVESSHRRVVLWTFGGVLVIGGLGIGAVVYQASHGTPQSDVEFVMINWITTGAFVGALVGIYDARRLIALQKLQTERDALEDATRQLERENERLDRFASIISHDLRNPLCVADNHLELVREECDSDHVEDVATAHERMETLIDDVLTLAREGKAVEATDAVDLSTVAEACWENVETGAASLTVTADQTILADEGRLKQLFENLFRNAVEHGGEAVSVTVGDLADGFYVADDGPGIPEADRDKVFAFAYSGTSDGTGLGLAIVHEIATAHSWVVDVTDSADGGARFECTGVDTVEKGIDSAAAPERSG